MLSNYISLTKSIGAKIKKLQVQQAIHLFPALRRALRNLTAKLKSSMTVSESGWRGGHSQPTGDLSAIHTSATQPSCAKSWKHSQSLTLSVETKTKPQVFHFLTASFSAIYLLEKLKINKNKQLHLSAWKEKPYEQKKRQNWKTTPILSSLVLISSSGLHVIDRPVWQVFILPYWAHWGYICLRKSLRCFG